MRRLSEDLKILSKHNGIALKDLTEEEICCQGATLLKSAKRMQFDFVSSYGSTHLGVDKEGGSSDKTERTCPDWGR